MFENSGTGRRLAEMNDAAAFEHIAAAVLRASSATYASLSHPGVKPGGKTVKAPFDNIGWVDSVGGRRFVCAAHTTGQKDLQGKWLHDPATVKPRRPGSKPTKPAGDLVKGIEEILKLRDTHLKLKVTFALTTNLEPSLDLLSSVESLAQAAEIEVDIWSVSRIAHFLDTDPIGQIIRKNYLGTPIKILSRELLLRMGKRGIQDHLPLVSTEDSISRESFVLGRVDTLVAGASGMGKTTACAVAMYAFIERGSPAILLKSEFVASAATIEIALEEELRRQEPEIESRAGDKAISLCSDKEPLLILVEDVNRSRNPGLVLNKIMSWALAPSRAWCVVCPVWPQYLDIIEDQRRVLAAVTVLRVDRYNPEEAIRAIQMRAKCLGLDVSNHRAKSLADQLGQDPLLIGLHDLVSEDNATNVIQAYMDERLGIVANQAQCTRSEVLQALHQLMRGMLEQRTLNPKWSEVKIWLSEAESIALLRSVAREGNLIRMASTGEKEILEFRHDRVMYKLLSGAIAEVLKTNKIPEYATDPFFSEAVAGAVLQIELPHMQLAELTDANPLVSARALKLASDVGSKYAEVAAKAVSHWLEKKEVRSDFFTSRRYAVARVLSETTSPYVRRLVSQFQEDDHPWYPLFSAAFRNGALNAGLSLLAMYDIGITIPGKQNLLALVKSMYGPGLISAVDNLLRRPDLNHFLNAGNRTGALRLAGYLGDSSLAQSIRVCWGQDEGGHDDLRSYLFAAARCCGDEVVATLGPVCDAWEALPEDLHSTVGQPVELLAADHVAWEFRDYSPDDAIRYFVDRANTSEILRRPITYMLRTVDHPDALEHLVRYAAESEFISRRFLKSDWERHARKSGRIMSSKSKERLLSICSDEKEKDDIRVQAFSFWQLTLDDLDLEHVCRIPVGSLLYESALWARVKLEDYSVVPEILQRIPENPEHWLQVSRYIWSGYFTDALDPILDQVAEDSKANSNLEYVVAETFRHVEPSRLVAMLSCRWEKLKNSPLMVQKAMLLGTPESADLVSKALATSPHPRALLKYFVSGATVSLNGKKELSESLQLQQLIPYLDYFPDDELMALWHECTERGWLDFRTRYLDYRVKKIPDNTEYFLDESVSTDSLDRALVRNPGEIVNLYHWLERPRELSANHEAKRAKIFASTMEWLTRHDEEYALAIVSDIISREGTRKEFYFFEKSVEQRVGSLSYVNSCRFDVFNRSLI
ncbi:MULTISPECIES: hypothetical protein [Pseudomonas syringae group]|uniref:Uncharacterized protein n=1 Tax=Pseudomonas syringae pv. ribicola TaxID=55398 RepID=A0A0N8SNH7_PSESI|nr:MULTISPECIES: hypothetical protein [Pseudomonas syringae group]EKN46724.1 hypothetical protein AAI_10531 [Pseudomonas viridiflava UASWS0038]KPL64840.1 hypothetical protein PVFL_10055 [Pseudomonas viridiflava]KPY43624.1 Uncharacterized protein ALO47_02688 [Pseudomonas syringae pv. ribicola]OAG90992.1 hypothetical protein AO065_15275 [Pseudomonas viridiflava]